MPLKFSKNVCNNTPIDCNISLKLKIATQIFKMKTAIKSQIEKKQRKTENSNIDCNINCNQLVAKELGHIWEELTHDKLSIPLIQRQR